MCVPHLDWSSPKRVPSSRVWGSVLPAVSGRKKVARAPTIEHRPRISSGRIEENRAWGHVSGDGGQY